MKRNIIFWSITYQKNIIRFCNLNDDLQLNNEKYYAFRSSIKIKGENAYIELDAEYAAELLGSSQAINEIEIKIYHLYGDEENIHNLSEMKFIGAFNVVEIEFHRLKVLMKLVDYTARFKNYFPMKVFSPLCRANFTDQYCKVSISAYEYSGQISNIIDQYSFEDSTRLEPDNYFNYGFIIFQTGANLGNKFKIRRSLKEVIELDIVSRFAMKCGDLYKIYTGCDKSFEMCCNRYNNAINFHGEPIL